MTTEQKHQFKNLIDFIFAEKNVNKYLEDKTSTDDPRKNLEVKSEYYYEVRNAQYLLHVHGMIKRCISMQQEVQMSSEFGHSTCRNSKLLRRLIFNLAIYIRHKPYLFV
jgi:hypothetical protein